MDIFFFSNIIQNKIRKIITWKYSFYYLYNKKNYII